ncbi:MAG: FAD:protein FMN transferase [Candidatus Omnitrophica bacterium]|nr:FAD:protein FMN transferase [Candidatus Omnitrophota bacterium]
MYSPKVRIILTIALIAAWSFLILFRQQKLYKDNCLAMGTFVEVVSPSKTAAAIVFDEFRRIENLLSKYNPDSEVSKLNRIGKLKVNPETFYVINKAREFYLLSDGAFDITVAGLMDLWGFTDKKYRVPSEAEIKMALGLVGSDKIVLRDSDSMIQFKLPKMKIDLGGIAKGYALDCAVKKLKANNIKSCLINCGGQVFGLGDRFGKPWKVAIKNPRKDRLETLLELKNQSAATAGDYEQYFIKEGKRYCHILNPKSGYPADSGIKSVTVIASEGLTADALATAVFVLGRGKGEALEKKFPGIKVKLTDE